MSSCSWTTWPRRERFYREVIGCTVENALPQYGMLQLRAGAALIDLVDIGAEEGAWARPPVRGRPQHGPCLHRHRPLGRSGDARPSRRARCRDRRGRHQRRRHAATAFPSTSAIRPGNELELKGPARQPAPPRRVRPARGVASWPPSRRPNCRPSLRSRASRRAAAGDRAARPRHRRAGAGARHAVDAGAGAPTA